MDKRKVLVAVVVCLLLIAVLLAFMALRPREPTPYEPTGNTLSTT